MTERTEVVIVGGGIGGGALAYALAHAGIEVTVLEATEVYEDRVRGESMHAWGVKEARNLGVEEILMDAGAHIAPVWKRYASATDDAPFEIPMAMMVPEIPGTLNLRHPVACQALIDAAVAAGATVHRGVRDIKLAGGSSPTIAYTGPNGAAELQASFVVGADGRASTVRKQVGLTLEHQDAVGYIAGLLVDGLDGVPDDHDVMAGTDELFFLLFHQGGGRARVYFGLGLSGQHRFSGRQGTESFLAACAEASFPWAGQLAAATPAGPCATYPGTDTWTATPYADGVVLVGDAAGHNDPVIGEGLSIALRDARMVSELVIDGAREPADFAPYGAERSARMERLRFIADVIAVTEAEDADNRTARRAYLGERLGSMDPDVFPLLLGAFGGPESIPQDLLDPGLLDRIRAA